MSSVTTLGARGKQDWVEEEAQPRCDFISEAQVVLSNFLNRSKEQRLQLFFRCRIRALGREETAQRWRASPEAGLIW